jgi:hypothetical protein
MTLPNLIGCGAGKSGTTSLYYYLSQHPQIYMAVAKEVHYFSRHFDKGVSWYESHFAGANAHIPVVGEFSTSYMLDTAVPQRIAALIPAARLLFIFRNPIERAYSNYWFSISIGTQPREQSFSDAIRTPAGYEKYLESGFYYQRLAPFLRHFSLEQIHIMITEEFKKEPLQQMARCYQFLAVDSTFRPDVTQQYNVTVSTKNNKWMGTVFAAWVAAKQSIKPLFKRFPLGLRRALARLEKGAIQQVISEERPPMLAADRAFLADAFAGQNQKLAALMGRELTCWQ